MSWRNLDWLDVERQEYETALNDRVREAYLAAYSVLNKTFRARKQLYELEAAEAKNDAMFEDTIQQITYVEFRWDEQTQALAVMALSLLATLNKSFLDQLKALFDKSHAPDPKGYDGKSELQRRIAEYYARFGIALEKLDAFETVREVELARNCCLHCQGEVTDDYRNQTQQRLVGNDGKINITPELLDRVIVELARFSRELSDQLKNVREKTNR
jgi:hypothetical protein